MEPANQTRPKQKGEQLFNIIASAHGVKSPINFYFIFSFRRITDTYIASEGMAENVFSQGQSRQIMVSTNLPRPSEPSNYNAKSAAGVWHSIAAISLSKGHSLTNQFPKEPSLRPQKRDNKLIQLNMSDMKVGASWRNAYPAASMSRKLNHRHTEFT